MGLRVCLVTPFSWSRPHSVNEHVDGVARELRSLGRLERRVLVLSYGRGLTLREIGVQVGLSESGVCRVRARALRRLRSALCGSQEAA